MNYIIAYNGGAYGNFIGWFCKWLRGDVESRPWDHSMNNSHNWERVHHRNVTAACNNIVSGSIVHPKIRLNEIDVEKDIIYNIQQLLDYYDRVILSYSTRDSFIWNINNKHERIRAEGYYNFEKKFVPNCIEKWENKGNDIWEAREWLSFFMITQHTSEVGLHEIDSITHPRLLKITLKKLSEDFVQLANEISSFLNQELKRSDNEINSLHNEWLALQPHVNKDALTKQIANAIIKNQSIYNDKLTLIDTAEIQRILREEYGFEIKCYGLNKWPSDSKELYPLLKKVKNND